MDKIICIGKNYLEHALELGDAVPLKPVVFLKPPSVLKQVHQWGDTLNLAFPSIDTKVQPECEMVLRLTQGGYQMTAAQAASAFSEVTIGLDMTLRERQTQLKKNGHPWTIAKVFVDAAIVGPWIKLEECLDKCHDMMAKEFSLSIDGKLAQCGKAEDMLMAPTDLVVYLSQFFPLCEGDLIFTGTPAGVRSITPHSTAVLCFGDHQYQVRWD